MRNFLEKFHIYRTRICNPLTLIILIQDNCLIQKTIDVLQEAKKCKLNMFLNIPYSSKLNLLAENYFVQLKYYVLYHFIALPKESINSDTINQYKFSPFLIHIMKQWEEMTELHYDSTSTAHIFGAWKSVLNSCINGIQLSGQHIYQTSTYEPLILKSHKDI